MGGVGMICAICNLTWADKIVRHRNFKVIIDLWVCNYCLKYKIPILSETLRVKGSVIDNNIPQLKPQEIQNANNNQH